MPRLIRYSVISTLALAPLADAQDLPPETNVLEPVVVIGKAENLLGSAPSASKGQASAEELAERPFLRRGELMEVVPGLIVTQHSGGGKANQYFVRGYNLDHGTDFGISVAGMPANYRSHAHGQGYADVNFLIPETVEQLDYTKGPYYASAGDFSTAGTASFKLWDVLPGGIAQASYGENNYFRGLVADSFSAGSGDLSIALEQTYYDGPWVLPENFARTNLFARYHWKSGDTDYAITGMGYRAEWDATDQVPSRLIRSGAIDRLGFIDDTVGGDSQRYSLSFDASRETAESTTKLNLYGAYYDLDLFSNFTLFLEDPVSGDQFNQVENRFFTGGSFAHTWKNGSILGRETDFTLGLDTRHDFIDDIGLHKTRERQRLSTVREDDVYEGSIGVFGETTTYWTEWLRSTAGLRGDFYYFDVDSDNPENSGDGTDGTASPKLGLVLGPWAETEFYLNAGLGFHSNDARGVTTKTDPVDPLVRTYGYELGVRSQILPDVTSTLALFYVESESELLYVGDAGTNEPGGATQRYGIEWSNYWRPADWITLDAETTLTEARFSDTTEGHYVENAVPLTFSGGVTLGREEGPFASLRARYYSERPLVADRSVESDPAFQVNARLGYRKGDWEVALEALNLFDASDNDIEYFYASRVGGEPAGGVEDRHIHPIEPRTFRMSVTYRF